MNLQRVAVTAVVTALFGVTPALAGGRADHLMCYKMTDTLAITAAVDMIADLQPQFTQRGCTLVKPVEFCVPATKENVQPPPTANDLFGQPLRRDYICYLAKCQKNAAPTSQVLADQFGVRPVVKFVPTKVCVPAVKFPLPCGAPGSRACSGACPADEECAVNAAGQCGCQPAECGGTPDRAGQCGGKCPTDQICRTSVTTTGKIVCGCQPVPPPPCGFNPLAGACGGDCTDPTLKCLPSAPGGNDCACRQPPTQFCAPVAGAVPTCGGPCPSPDDVCTSTGDAANPCVCQPGPCRQEPGTGTCSGFCDPAGPGGTCHLNVDGQCTCGPSPCGTDPATGVCGGDCAQGEICDHNSANECTCITPCQRDAQNVCGGGCPPGLSCQIQGQDCTCVQPPPCGFGAGTAGVCGGFCPAGQSCQVKQVPRGNPQCLCL